MFRGYVNMGGISNCWNIGSRFMYKTAVHECGFGYHSDPQHIASRKKLLED